MKIRYRLVVMSLWVEVLQGSVTRHESNAIITRPKQRLPEPIPLCRVG